MFPNWSVKRTITLLNQSLIFHIVLTISTATHAIVMRHDVNPNEYLLDILDYQSTIVINNCSATLIAPRWILTAAHCTYPNLSDGIAPGSEVHFIQESISVYAVHPHPDFSQGTATDNTSARNDIALVELAEPSFSVLPVPVYEQHNELGKVMKLAGYGVVGDGERDIYDTCFPCPLRGADNRVEEITEHHLRFRFDHPDNSNSLPLEGVGAGGDSGGPVYFETPVGRFVAGVSSFGSREYNGFDNYVRVSNQLSWIFEVMGSEYVGQYSGPVYSQQQSVLSQEQNNNSSGGAFGFAWLYLICLLVRNRR